MKKKIVLRTYNSHLLPSEILAKEFIGRIEVPKGIRFLNSWSLNKGMVGRAVEYNHCDYSYTFQDGELTNWELGGILFAIVKKDS